MIIIDALTGGGSGKDTLYLWRKSTATYTEKTGTFSSSKNVVVGTASNGHTSFVYATSYTKKNGEFVLVNPKTVNLANTTVSSGYCCTEIFSVGASPTVFKPTSSGKYLHKIGGTVQYSSSSTNPYVLIPETEYHTLTVAHSNVTYVVSDKANAFPDKGEATDGFFYEKIKLTLQDLGCTKYEVGTFTYTSGTSYKQVSHSLGVVPKFALIMYEVPNAGNSDTLQYAIHTFNDSGNASGGSFTQTPFSTGTVGGSTATSTNAHLTGGTSLVGTFKYILLA